MMMKVGAEASRTMKVCGATGNTLLVVSRKFNYLFGNRVYVEAKITA